MKKPTLVVKLHAMILSLTFLAVCFALNSCSEEQTTTPINNKDNFIGKFLTQNGEPLAKIVVEATDSEGNLFATDTTKEDGSFVIKNIPASLENSIITFIQENEVIQQEKLNNFIKSCNSSKTNQGNVFLGGDNDCETVFKLTIVNNETSLPIPEADVKLGTSENAIFKEITNDAGNVFFSELCPGRYSLRVYKKGYETYEDAFLLLFPEGTDTLNYTVKLLKKTDSTDYNDSCCNNSVFIKVKEIVNNQTIIKPNIKVHLRSLDFPDSDSKVVISDKNGIAHFENLCEGKYIAVIELEGYQRAAEDFRIECGEKSKNIAIILKKKETEECCNNKLIVKLFDKNGNKIKNAQLFMWKNGNKIKTTYFNDGIAVFGNICKGKYGFDVYPTDSFDINQQFKPIEFAQEFGCEDTIIIEKVVKIIEDDCCNNWVELFVLDSLTKGIENVKIKLWKGDKLIRDPITNSEGKVVFEELCKGKYAISIKTEVGNKEFEFEVDCNEKKKIVKYISN